MKKFGLMVMMIVLSLGLLAGCGGKDPDMMIFMMPLLDQQIPSEVPVKMQEKVQAHIGNEKTVQVNASPMNNRMKLMGEVAIKKNGIMILPEIDMRALGNSAGLVPLEDLFDSETYTEGYVDGIRYEDDAEGNRVEIPEKHLYALPISKMKVFQELKFTEEKLFAIIPSNAPDKEIAKDVLKMLAE